MFYRPGVSHGETKVGRSRVARGFKPEAVRLSGIGGFSYAEASEDLKAQLTPHVHVRIPGRPRARLLVAYGKPKTHRQ